MITGSAITAGMETKAPARNSHTVAVKKYQS